MFYPLHNTVWDQKWDKERGNLEDFWDLSLDISVYLCQNQWNFSWYMRMLALGTLKTQNVLPPLLCLPLLLFYKKAG